MTWATENLPFGTEVYDTGDIFDPAENTRLTVPAGASVVKLSVNTDLFFVQTNANATASIIKNGAYVSGLPFSNNRAIISATSSPQQVVPGDYFEVRIVNNNATDGIVFNSTTTWFSMEVIR